MSVVSGFSGGGEAELTNVTSVSTAPRDFFAYVVSGDIEKVRDAIKLDEDLVYSRGAGGSTGLHLALFHAEYAIARLLVAKGADLDCENNVGRLPQSYDRAQSRLDFMGQERKHIHVKGHPEGDGSIVSSSDGSSYHAAAW